LYESLHIHDGIAISILSKLTIKSLKRFECVRKSWSLLFDIYRNNLLTKDHPYCDDDASVLLFQKNRHGYNESRFKNKVKLDWSSVKLDDQRVYNSDFDILGSGSVHKTLCLICSNQGNIILWNPFNKEVKHIPPLPFISGPYWGVYNAYYGFGFDRVRHDYKMMYYITNIDCSDVDLGVHPDTELDISYYGLMMIYSLRTNSWRILDLDMCYNPDDWEGQLYMDGLSHWLCERDLDNGDSDYTHLLSFDWSNEVFLTTPTPMNG